MCVCVSFAIFDPYVVSARVVDRPHPAMIASDVEFIFAASGGPLAVDGMPFIFRAGGRSIEEAQKLRVAERERERERDLQTVS